MHTGGVEVYLHSFLSLVVDGEEWNVRKQGTIQPTHGYQDIILHREKWINGAQNRDCSIPM
jgi:hypothetical protein